MPEVVAHYKAPNLSVIVLVSRPSAEAQGAGLPASRTPLSSLVVGQDQSQAVRFAGSHAAHGAGASAGPFLGKTVLGLEAVFAVSRND